MTNIEKAAQVIDNGIKATVADPCTPWYTDCPGKIAQALAAEGLLMPELPEPDDVFNVSTVKFTKFSVPNSESLIESVIKGGSTGGIYITLRNGQTVGADAPMTPATARKLARTLLAAANHAEGGKK